MIEKILGDDFINLDEIILAMEFDGGKYEVWFKNGKSISLSGAYRKCMIKMMAKPKHVKNWEEKLKEDEE